MATVTPDRTDPLVVHLTPEAFAAGVTVGGKRLLNYDDMAAMTGRESQTFSALRTPSRQRRRRVRMPDPVMIAIVTGSEGRAERPLFDPDAMGVWLRQVGMLDEHGQPANLRFREAALARSPR